MGTELNNTAKIIARSGVFDEVDKKYGIPEGERQELESGGVEGESPDGGMGGDMGSPPPPPVGDEGPLSESTKKSKILGMLGDSEKSFDELFDIDKAQRNIYEIENKLKDIINE